MEDIIIIGGGPSGLFSLYIAGLHHMQATLVEKLDRVGGQLEHLYPEKPIYDVGGFPMIRGHELVERLKEQAGQYPTRIMVNQTVTGIQRMDQGWRVMTETGAYQTLSVLITGGIGDFLPRKFNDPAIDQYEHQGLYYVVNRLEDFRNQRVLVVGGGDSAADWAMALSDVAQEVTMIHRRDSFQCHADSFFKLQQAPQIHLVPNAELKRVSGVGHVQSVDVLRRDQDRVQTWPMDKVIVAIGLVAGTAVFKTWGLEMEGHEIHVASSMATNLPGVFAAGDIVSYPGKVKLIAAGFGEAATAVEAAREWIRKTAH
ncbi:MAG: NAD(P)/FAD-dependent oxidoreductase [Sulfobacillus sp.]